VPLAALRDGRTLAWSEGGDPGGTPVLFFHGCPDTRRAAWSGYAAARAAGVRLVAANRPGYGASTPAPPSYRRVVDDTAELADSLGIDCFSVLGMSVGGTFALASSALLPERVVAAAVVATPGESQRMDPAYPRDDLDEAGRSWFTTLAQATAEQRLELVRSGFLEYRATVDPQDRDDAGLAARWLAALPPDDRALVDGPVAEVAAAAREAILVPDGYVCDASLAFGPWPFRVEDIGCPVTLWYGEHDANAPARNGVWLADHLTRATFEVVTGQGHLGSLMRSWDRILAGLTGPPDHSPAAP
jgi:pimeloyl-ACP methyl ester carboxylesterase